MTDEIEELRHKIARTEQLVPKAEAQSGVRAEKFDDKKKGPACRNLTARATFKKEWDRHAQELVELKARLIPDPRVTSPVGRPPRRLSSSTT